MILAPNDVYEKLEFDKIKALITAQCLGEPGRHRIEKLELHTQKFIIERMLNEVEQYKTTFEENHHFPMSNYEDLSEEIKMLKVAGFVMSEAQLKRLADTIRIIYRIFQFFKKDKKEAYPTLYDIVRNIHFNDDLLQAIDRVIDEEGKIKSDASPELMRIRRLHISKRKELDKVFRSLINEYKSKGLLKDTIESFRNGRRVLSAPVENKRRIRGIIHDESATGKTAFIEPEAVIQINNDIFDLENEEKREIYRILRDLTESIQPYLPLIQEYHIIIARYDVIQAKAKLALDLDACKPKLKSEPFIGIRTGYHPLLFLKNKKEGKTTIPFTLSLLNNNRILVLSGPNAGGKSIALKSLGLMQLMLQSGMLVPVDAESEMGVFEKLFIDIGDQQSLEDELSTYSSRLKNMKIFLEKSDDKTLILIDEFGSGTDPKIGGAIAEAILKELNQKQIFGLITTHYSNLKIFAYKNKGIVNGSMKFDMDNLSPTYELTVGKPGSSYAFEIAEKSGLDKKIIEYAKHKTGKNEKAIDQLIVDLQREKQDLEEKLTKIEAQQGHFDKLVKNYEQMNGELEYRRRKLKLDIKQNALQEKAQVNKELEKRIREIRQEQNLDKAKAALQTNRDDRENISKEVYQLHEDIYHKPTKNKKDDTPIEVGDYVRFKTGGDISTVESIHKNNAIIIVGALRMTVKLRDLQKAGAPVTAPVKGKINADTVVTTANFVNKLDLRGMRRDEAIKTVELFVDEALIANGSTLEIIHGKGDGILRRAVKQKLREYKAVQSVKHGDPKGAGDGVTIVELG